MSRRLTIAVLTVLAAALTVFAMPSSASAKTCQPGVGVGPC
jgi:hypothetical protein